MVTHCVAIQVSPCCRPGGPQSRRRYAPSLGKSSGKAGGPGAFPPPSKRAGEKTAPALRPPGQSAVWRGGEFADARRKVPPPETAPAKAAAGADRAFRPRSAVTSCCRDGRRSPLPCDKAAALAGPACPCPYCRHRPPQSGPRPVGHAFFYPSPSSRNCRMMESPTSPLFSGWNWQPVTLPLWAAAQTRRPPYSTSASRSCLRAGFASELWTK